MMERRMKDSGIPWIGMIPEDWGKDKILRIFQNFGSGTTPKGENYYIEETSKDSIPWINSGDLNFGYINNVKKHVSVKAIQEVSSLKIYPPDSIIIAMYGASIGKVAISKLYGCTNQACQVLYNTNEHLKYLFYLFYSIKDRWVELSYGGTQPNINADNIKQTWLPIPPLSEQETIASWLDEKCGEIDELVEVEHKMIETLETYRQATITETVTHGLNPDSPMRQSTIDQLEEIPSHWGESRLLKIVYLRARLGWRGLKSDEYVDEGYPFLSAFNIIDNKLDWAETNYINQFRYDESPEIKLSIGDILLVKDGAGIGKCACVDDMPKGESTVNSSLGVITVSNKLNYKYLYFYFLSHLFQELTERLRNGMGVPHLTQESMKSLVIPLPPINEQRAIADYLDTKCKDIDELIAVKREKIETLKEYRQSIIFEAVTGKIQIN